MAVGIVSKFVSPFLGAARRGAESAYRAVTTGLRGSGSSARTTSQVAPDVATTARDGALLRQRSIFPRQTAPDPANFTRTIPNPAISGIDDIVTRGRSVRPQNRSQILDDLSTAIKKIDPKYASTVRPIIKETKDFLQTRGRKSTAQDRADKFTQTLDELRTGTAQRLGTQVVPDEAALKTATEAFETAAAKRQAIERGLNITGGLAATALPIAEMSQGENASPELRLAAAIASALPGAKLLGRGLGDAFRAGRKGTGVTFADIARILGGSAGVYYGVDLARNLGNEAAADEAVSTPIIPPAATPGAGAATDPLQEAIDNINAQAQAELAAVEAGVGSALDELVAAYGGDARFEQALLENDQMLAMELAAIEADANAARQQIANNYDAALLQIEGYTTQAGEALSEAAMAQQAGAEAAAGALQAATVPSGMGGAEAAAAGISGTALGGAGVTGAALARSQAGAASSQQAADKAAVVTSLSDQAATGRLNEADILSALDRGIIDAKQASRIDSANRKSKIREAQAESKLQVAQIKYEAEAQAAQARAEIESRKLANELNLRQTFAQLTPEQRAAYTGRTQATAPIPSWLVETATPETLDVNVGAAGKTKVTGREADRIKGAIASYYAAAPDRATNPSTSLAYWAEVFVQIEKTFPSAQKQLESLGLPSTPAQISRAFTTGQ